MLRFIIGVIFGVLVIIFMVQNADQAQITFLFWTFSLSRSLMYLLVFALGFGTGGLITGMRNRKKKIKKEESE